LSVSFVGGFIIAEQKLFPYGPMHSVWEKLVRLLPTSQAPAPQTTGWRGSSRAVTHNGSTVIQTNLLQMRAETFPWTLDAHSSIRGGGGLALLGDSVIGVDKSGVFFYYEGRGVMRELPLTVQTNIEDLRRQKGDTEAFRFMDIAAVQNGARNELFVSYHYWYPEQQCKTARVSRLIFEDARALISPLAIDPPQGWETIFESHPCIEYGERNDSGFQSNVNGGRLVADGRNGLFFSLGDHHLDGVNNPLMVAQDSRTSYGKIIRIDLETLEARIYANGVRNPQGLFLDRAGNLWDTEQGPKGGDELNLIKDQGNYGWPLTTFGTQYFKFDWELNTSQGHHDGRDRGFEVPTYAWIPSVGVSNLTEVGEPFQRWQDNFLVSSLTARSLFRLGMHEGRVVFAERIEIGERIRDLIQMPDGAILLWLDARGFMELTLIAESDADGHAADLIGTCGTCHSFAPGITSTAGPNLWGVFGRAIGSTDYGYSDAFRSAAGVWDEETLRAFLLDPQRVVPGTVMPTPPSPDPKTIDTLIAMLRALR
jgi:cytochrome c2